MSTKIISTESNTGFMSFPSRGTVVAHVDGEYYTADVSQFQQLPLPSALDWVDGFGVRAEIEFTTAMYFR